jgi:lipoprotein-anchoring transpeptidase ErfK/SrfK
MHVGEQEISISGGRFWRIAILAAAGAIGGASYAEAAAFWSDSDPGISRPGPSVPQRRQNSRRHQAKKIEVAEKESAKPQGPLIIAISIEKQRLRIYDANGFYAETPISTGMRGHPTPMGVFSVIQKHKLHHSNIYSNAPMPFMQRITWSGVAMHAGVLPGYPASHGCIRMPMAFAVKMWNWTKMGARVVVTPGELTPSHFSHPLLAALKVVPQPVAPDEPVVSPAAKSDKAADADTTAKPVVSERSAATPLREQTHTADARATATKAPVTMSDATSDAASAKTGDAASTDKKSEAAQSEAEPAAAKPSETASPADKPAETKSSEVAIADIKPVESDTTDKADTKSDDAPVSAQANSDAVTTEARASETVKPDETNVEAKVDDAKTDNKTDDLIKSATGTVADVKKDQTRLTDPVKSAAAKSGLATATAPKRAGQISVFISRKDQKLYVRQNFAPLFDVPVTIAPDVRPLGTHVFTAQADKNDANVLHWSVVTLPGPSRNAERRDEDERASRRHKIAGVIEMKPMPVPDSPAEALDRLTIPTEAMARIVDALSTGGSIIVSDQGINAGETGEGTDFIVSLR